MEMDVEYLQMGNLLDPNRTPVMISSVGSQKGLSLFIPLPKTFWSPFWTEQQRHGKKNCRLAGEPLPLRSTPFHLFLFLSARSLGALFRQRGSDRTFRGDSIRGTERRRTKVLTRLPRSMNKTWPSFFFRGTVPFATFWGTNLLFFPPCSALFSC